MSGERRVATQTDHERLAEEERAGEPMVLLVAGPSGLVREARGPYTGAQVLSDPTLHEALIDGLVVPLYGPDQG